ncbi:hypothetical protein COCCADRAFT_103308 [Bipolaris zeicola 26-R-13]|uniref:Transmembrane protein UsgS n=1 Tax=Cochliobolus carbonum (strain 26-R-13) TaxID=930089 RepID=W6XY26_COCC2|nr:uncharacterized protein COCCADRAFT_103308 [Bipolaris zeicola 26-R-13]EUC30653.1 hypothetical protein COCCADRAFT_103308 [Bipolaris zeicola 26-R-13]
MDKIDIANFDVSNFDPNAILRGAQLTLVGVNRALQNPRLFTSDHYRQAAIAVAAGVAIRIIVAIPIVGVRVLLWILSLFVDMSQTGLDETIIDGLHFLEHSVLQVPFFLMTLMRYVTPTLDQMFMDSLRWVDETYVQKHKTDDPHNLRAMYYPNLEKYPDHAPKPEKKEKKPLKQTVIMYATKQSRKAAISLGVLALSYVPYIGRLVLPAASFYTFKKAVGTQPAAAIFAMSLLFPRRYLVSFLQAYFSSRTLMRELLEPYFSRVRYTKEQKKLWFKDRAGVLFGFGLGFYIFVKIPLVGVLIYGLAEASTAYLITKITEPPLPPTEAEKFKEESLRWKNKHEFLNMPWQHMDEYNLAMHRPKEQSEVRQTPRKTFS